MFHQIDFDIKLEWGLKGISVLAPVSDVIIIVDILSFSTCVDIVTQRNAKIYPYQWKDASAFNYAEKQGAQLASFTRESALGYSLSPSSLTTIKPNTKLVLPSPNGSALSLATKGIPTLCGCLRNAQAVAQYALSLGSRISVIPAGEKWEDDTLRPSVEDWLGAGAIISFLKGSISPEEKAAMKAYESLKENLLKEIKNCGSGRELIDRGFEKDIDLACELNVSDNVPFLRDHFYSGHKIRS